MKYEGDLRNCTPERLAEMLEEHNKWRRGVKPFNGVGDNPPFTSYQIGRIIDEAARRLRELNKPTYEDYE